LAVSKGARVASHRRLRVALAGLLGASVAFSAAIPVAANWPVVSQASYVSQWSSGRHKAVDIAARAGTLVVPIKAGTVVFAGWKSNCGGWQVWVDHGNGLYSAYYHLKVETTYRGERVDANNVIASVGSSGCASGSHVHVEVWRGYPWRTGSYRLNPWAYIDSGRYLPYRYA